MKLLPLLMVIFSSFLFITACTDEFKKSQKEENRRYCMQQTGLSIFMGHGFSDKKNSFLLGIKRYKKDNEWNRCKEFKDENNNDSRLYYKNANELINSEFLESRLLREITIYIDGNSFITAPKKTIKNLKEIMDVANNNIAGIEDKKIYYSTVKIQIQRVTGALYPNSIKEDKKIFLNDTKKILSSKGFTMALSAIADVQYKNSKLIGSGENSFKNVGINTLEFEIGKRNF